MRAVDPTHDDSAAGYRKRVKVLAELFNSSSQLTTGRAASAYEYAAELITEAADSYTDTGDDPEDISALYRAINHAAIEGLNLAAYEASERDEQEARRAAGYDTDTADDEERAAYDALWTTHPDTNATAERDEQEARRAAGYR